MVSDYIWQVFPDDQFTMVIEIKYLLHYAHQFANTENGISEC